MPRPVPQAGPISIDVAIRGLQQKQLICSRLKAELETAIEDLEEARRKRHICEITLERDTAARESKAREGFYTSTSIPPSSLRADYQARTHYISSDTHLVAVESLADDKFRSHNDFRLAECQERSHQRNGCARAEEFPTPSARAGVEAIRDSG